jgi:sugar lactone lactonase YvrE
MRTLIERGSYFESPRFHGGKLWLCDTLTSKILRTTLGRTSEMVCKINGVPSGIGFLPRGDLVIVSMFRQKLYRCADGKLSGYVDLSSLAAGTLADLLIDPAGRAYVGDLGFDLLQGIDYRQAGPVGQLLLVNPDMSGGVVAAGLEGPSGIALSGDGRSLYVAERAAGRIAEFRVAQDGSLELLRRFGSFGEPDGICLDQEGALWVACFAENAFVHVDERGRELTRIETPGRHAVACVLGGDDGRTLFCISAETTHRDLLQGRSKARVDVVSVHTPGAGLP